MVLMTARPEVAIEGEEVIAVVCHDDPPVLLSVGEQLRVGKTTQCGELVDGYRIMAAAAELLGDHGGQHLVEQQLHASAFCSRRHSSSAASASSMFRWSRSSISARYSA